MENENTPPPKRPRLDNEGSVLEEEPPKRSPDYWFDSGDVILQAEDVQFRVHREMLARHSNVFRDMFNIPQGENTDERVIHDCPVVPVSEMSSEIEYILSIFYDNLKKHDWTKPMAISHISILLRVGKKYEIDYLTSEALRRLRGDHPTTLSEWEVIEKPREYKIIEQKQGVLEPYSKVIILGHEHDVQSILPAAYLRFAQTYRLGAILENQASGKDLSLQSRINCAVGRDAILLESDTRRRAWLQNIEQLLPAHGCPDPDSCPTLHLAAADKLPLWSRVGFSLNWNKLRPLDDDDLAGLCQQCTKAVRSKYDGIRAEIWAKLPSYFRLGEWQDLKDFDA